MLKIAVVTAHFPSSAHPTIGRPAFQTLRVLSQQCDVEVFYPHAAYPSFLKPRGHLSAALDDSYALPDVKVDYCDYPVLPLVSRPLNGWMAARVLLPRVRRFSPDLIFSYVLYPDGYAALKIARSLSIPVVTMGVGSDVHNIRDRFSLMHTRTVLRSADFMLAISEDLRKRMVAMGAPAEKTGTLVSGCDSSVFYVRDRQGARRHLNIAPDAEAVVYIGRLDFKKGLRELVEAAASIHHQRSNLHVYLVGDGPDRPLLETAIQAHNAAGYIHAMPGCTFDDVAVWIAASNLVTLPSYMEGCPNVVLEALACGRPVVATNVGGIPEIMSDACGKLVPPRDTAALANALASVLDKTWDAADLSAHWSRSWNVVASELLSIFETLMASREAAKAHPAV